MRAHITGVRVNGMALTGFARVPGFQLSFATTITLVLVREKLLRDEESQPYLQRTHVRQGSAVKWGEEYTPPLTPFGPSSAGSAVGNRECQLNICKIISTRRLCVVCVWALSTHKIKPVILI